METARTATDLTTAPWDAQDELVTAIKSPGTMLLGCAYKKKTNNETRGENWPISLLDKRREANHEGVRTKKTPGRLRKLGGVVPGKSTAPTSSSSTS